MCLLAWFSRCSAYAPNLPHIVLCKHFTELIFLPDSCLILKFHRKMEMPVQNSVVNSSANLNLDGKRTEEYLSMEILIKTIAI